MEEYENIRFLKCKKLKNTKIEVNRYFEKNADIYWIYWRYLHKQCVRITSSYKTFLLYNLLKNVRSSCFRCSPLNCLGICANKCPKIIKVWIWNLWFLLTMIQMQLQLILSLYIFINQQDAARNEVKCKSIFMCYTGHISLFFCFVFCTVSYIFQTI